MRQSTKETYLSAAAAYEEACAMAAPMIEEVKHLLELEDWADAIDAIGKECRTTELRNARTEAEETLLAEFRCDLMQMPGWAGADFDKATAARRGELIGLALMA